MGGGGGAVVGGACGASVGAGGGENGNNRPVPLGSTTSASSPTAGPVVVVVVAVVVVVVVTVVTGMTAGASVVGGPAWACVATVKLRDGATGGSVGLAVIFGGPRKKKTLFSMVQFFRVILLS